MRSHAIAVIAGDGLGPKVFNECQRVLDASADNFGLEWVSYPYGATHYLKKGETLPDAGLQEISTFDAIYLGPIGHPKVRPAAMERHFFRRMRSCFDQYVCLRHAKLYENIPTVFSDLDSKDVDFYIVRENTEGFYKDIGGTFWERTGSEMAVQAGVVSRLGCERIMRYAFELARNKKRHLVTSCDKANTLPHSSFLWRKVLCEVSRNYRGIRTEFNLVDSIIQSLITNPSHYGVIVAPNMFGDVLGELAALLQGGSGMAHTANINPKGISAFGPIPSIMNMSARNANPIGSILAGAMMLENIGEKRASARVKKAVSDVLRTGKHRTPDIGGRSTTSRVGEAIEKGLGK
ncbi:MAG: isocitrate/isopropylmalate family dehydrogenase [Candidatus Micrarchaeota archaeon]